MSHENFAMKLLQRSGAVVQKFKCNLLMKGLAQIRDRS